MGNYSKEYEALVKKGMGFSERYIPQEEQNKINFTHIKTVAVPIYFFLDRYDWLTPTSYPEKFLNEIIAPDKKIIWFENSGHLMMMEEPQKFQTEIIKITLAAAIATLFFTSKAQIVTDADGDMVFNMK